MVVVLLLELKKTGPSGLVSGKLLLAYSLWTKLTN
jgi:hypothetical protein